MSTHAILGVRMPDGTVSGTYVHFDGDTMEPRIDDYLDVHTTTDLAVLIMHAQSRGGIRSFHTPTHVGPDERITTTDLSDVLQPYVITEGNWEEDHMGTHTSYLVDYQTGEIDIVKRYQGMYY